MLFHLPPAIPQPPSVYQPATVTTTARFLPDAEVDPTCRALGTVVQPRMVIEACTVRDLSGAPVVIMPTLGTFHGTPQAWAELMTHELGHVAGWPANHPR